MVDLDVAISVGSWAFDGDAKGDYQEMEYNEEGQVIGQTTTEYEYALDGLKIGDMPQTAYVGGLTIKPIKGLNVQGLYRWYDNHYADWSPDSREVSGDVDRAQVWKISILWQVRLTSILQTTRYCWSWYDSFRSYL